MGRFLGVAVALLVAHSTLLAQSTISPPVLIQGAADPAAPAASAVLLPGRNMTVNAVAVDPDDNLYVAGSGDALGIPGLDRGFDASPDGVDAFAAKLDRNGNVVWATYLGGTDRQVRGPRVTTTLSDAAHAMAVDAAGQVYIAGTTGSDSFPVVGGFQTSRLGDTDGFIAKLSADGRRLLYSSYIGASGDSMLAHGIAVGPAGDVTIRATSPLQRWLPTRDVSGGTGRVVIVKLNAAGTPIWSTRVGLEGRGGFAVDGAGRAYAAGANCGVVRDCRQVLLRLDPSGALHFSISFANRNANVYTSALALLPGGRAAFSGVAFDPLPTVNAWAEPAACPTGPGTCGEAFLGIAGESGELETLSHLGLGEAAPMLAADPHGRVMLAIDSLARSRPLNRPLVDHHVDGPIYVSRDRATTWRVADRDLTPVGIVDDLAFNWLRNTLYAIANGIFESRDEVTSWRLDSGPGFGTDDWYRIAVDRRRPSIRYAIFGDHVMRHDEGAPGWRMVYRSAQGFYQRTVVVSPHDSSVWIAGNAGVAMSGSGGDSWIDRSAGLPNLRGSSPTVEHLEFDPRQAGTVYALTQVGLYRTRNNGETWEHLTGPVSPPPALRAIAFDPVNSDTIHLAALNHGLLKTSDGGRTWAQKLTGNRITVVQTDHMKRHIVYAGGSDAGGHGVFYRSIDFGETWHRADDGLHMRGEPSRVIVDPRDSLTLYVGTATYEPVPHVMRLQPDAVNTRRFVPEFASYLGHGRVRALASTLSGGLVGALAHAWPTTQLNQQQIVMVRIAP
jgi:hypothetical protein